MVMAPLRIKPQTAKLLTKAITKANTISETRKNAQNTQIARANADAKKVIAQIRLKADQEERLYGQIISKVQSETEHSIASIKSESAAEIDKVRTEAEEAIDREKVAVRTEARAVIVREQTKADKTISALKIEAQKKSEAYKNAIAAAEAKEKSVG